LHVVFSIRVPCDVQGAGVTGIAGVAGAAAAAVLVDGFWGSA
jgi:hypothetical protein